MRLLNRVSPLLLIAILFGGCQAPPRTQTELWLGTGCTITVYGRGSGGRAVEAAFDRVERIHRLMSLQEPGSELNTVNDAPVGSAVEVSEETATVLREALRVSVLSDGGFDPTVGALVKLWDIGGADATQIPPPEAVAEATASVDYRAVTLSSRDVTRGGAGSVIDLGGIAKGYAADEAALALVQGGVRAALLDFGGNILLVGQKPDRTPWRVGVQNPLDNRGRYLGVLELEGGSVVTSGVYERFFVKDGVRYHHILDPGTGYPARTGLLSVTIVAPSSMTADALSTAVFVLGQERGMVLVESIPDTEALFVTEDREVVVTAGLRNRFRLTDEEFRLAP
jgi:thiamine biosynthesis lipoprotein